MPCSFGIDLLRKVACRFRDACASIALEQEAARRLPVVPDNNVLRDDDSLLARTMGVTDHVIAATQRAVSTIGVIPTWIGSIGNRLGG
jgi:hypothetical protein